jgi:hypothetical protein
VQDGEEPERQEVEESGEEHALDVRDQFRLTNQPIQAGRLLKALKVEKTFLKALKVEKNFFCMP